ncbi:carbohydrate-binding protein [Streptomyces sp. SPB162]|uniref:dioxygenase family protein n=1 Tax=Streptomyces sp. SPB162 TaxID=2940560 RepID=UPI002404BDDF|nr:carbohydrate-binding protein [Streptomyces sp. SPB162]MDF9810839.1 protocatechuate 3,4-dioxygenase beta subunit [Streptomyces sp. SPB162]
MPTPHDESSGSPALEEHRGISRKNLIKAALLAGTVPLLTGGGVALARDRAVAAPNRPLSATPACHDGDATTLTNIEGPYFKPNSPLRTNLVGAGLPGTPLTVSGYVFGRDCRPVSGALLDFWQADDNGGYDMNGFTLRGHQFSTAQGAFGLTTIVPGLYPGRTRHIHVKVQAPGKPILTTQLYFPNEPRNSTDAYYDRRLQMTVRQVGSGEQATFDFVLNVTGSPTPPPTTPPPTTPGGEGTWAPDTAYQAGRQVTYGGQTYQCVQAHTSMAGWEPPNVPALWQRL